MADCSEQVSNTDPPSRPDTFDSDKSFQLTVIYVYIDQIGDSLATFKCSMNIMKSVPPKNKWNGHLLTLFWDPIPPSFFFFVLHDV